MRFRVEMASSHGRPQLPAVDSQATVQCKQKTLDSAQERFNRALQMLRRLLGESKDNSQVAACLFDLGVVGEEKDELADAERFYQLSLAMNRRLRGVGVVGWDVANTLSRLAKLLAKKVNRHEASNLFLESYAMCRELGRSYPDLKRDLKTFYDLINQASYIQEFVNLQTLVPECLGLGDLCHVDEDDCRVDVTILFRNWHVCVWVKEMWRRRNEYFS